MILSKQSSRSGGTNPPPRKGNKQIILSFSSKVNMVGKNIKKRREALGMTQKELAEKVQVVPSMITQIERGGKVPTILLADNIAKVLGCTANDLLKERD